MRTEVADPRLVSLDRVLDSVRREPRLVAALRHASALQRVAAHAPAGPHTSRLLAHSLRGADAITTLAVLHALGAVKDPSAERVLIHTVREAQPTFAAHAAWALASHRPSPQGRAALAGLVAERGLGGMLAARALRDWNLASGPRVSPVPSASSELVVVQPFLHARLDRTGSGLGVGDAGGIASLLRSLGTALATQRGIGRIVTVTRGRPGEPASEQLTAGHWVHRIPFGGATALPQRDAWMYDAQIERELLALGRALSGCRVVWHLRMADVGSLAAAAVARRLGHPFVFTAAPDPHTEIDALQAAGHLDRARFLAADSQHQYWFRARVVEQLAADADRLTLLPRPSIEQELIELVGLDPADLAVRAVVVPEGVDLVEIEGARARRARHGDAEITRTVLSRLPAARRRLPWLLTVGRLHPAKGMDRLTRAVAEDSALSSRVNVVVVGGELEDPSPDERATLAAIHRSARRAPPGTVTCTGHLPPAAVSDLLAHLAAQGGVYVCASAKEEFGLAVVEALAAGAVVVAPARGGPRTYVEDGVTGVLCDTTSIDTLRAAIERGLALVPAAGRADRARSYARAELGVDRMAARLARVYRDLLAPGVRA